MGDEVDGKPARMAVVAGLILVERATKGVGNGYL
jgi:hypothetical protein